MPFPRLIVVQPHFNAPSETFIAAHQFLPGFDVDVAYGDPVFFRSVPVLPPRIGSASVLAGALKAIYKGVPLLAPGTPRHLYLSYFRLLNRIRPAAVLAEYGPWACNALPACRALRIPLVAHFHGFDASHTPTLEAHRTRYRELFGYAAATVAVSTTMRSALCAFGAPPAHVHLIPYGVDTEVFRRANPCDAEYTFVAVGRLVPKKAPLLTLAAFATALQRVPHIRLVFVGDGPLMGECRRFLQTSGLEDAVRMPGALTHAEVAAIMRTSRAFLQHSVVAPDGDSEGMPVAVLEALASGLPVIATRHGGIPEAVLHEKTGLLCDEKDVATMAAHIVRIAQDNELAHRLGQGGRDHVCRHFDQRSQLAKLATVIHKAIQFNHSGTPEG